MDAVIKFDDGTVHTEPLLVTRLHPSARIVLGLPWLRKYYNPTIDWKTMTLAFEGHSCLGATVIPDSKKRNPCFKKVELEEIVDEEFQKPRLTLGLDDPLLLHESEMAEYLYQKTLLTSKSNKGQEKPAQDSVPDMEPMGHDDSSPPKASIDSSCPPNGERTSDIPCTKDTSPETPKLKAPYISLIGAAPFQTLIRQGCEAYVLHIYPSREESEVVGLAASTGSTPSEP
ncbi:hypothetical protein F5878DRAFT_646227 [Lentinula raphanica]|uniref:Uncharacterized protein n=1 Tax=Lentinula raphanica TaxID=153919 RepID=A0AA38NYQ0_9AGAR|nr:hypothetical protein F5878DRAFT_646227 [Lentinula raphanica]